MNHIYNISNLSNQIYNDGLNIIGNNFSSPHERMENIYPPTNTKKNFNYNLSNNLNNLGAATTTGLNLEETKFNIISNEGFNDGKNLFKNNFILNQKSQVCILAI